MRLGRRGERQTPAGTTTASMVPCANRPTIFIVAACVFTVRAFLVDLIVRLTRDYSVTLVASGLDGEPELQRTLEGVAFVDILIARRPAPLTDLSAWVALVRLFAQRKPTAVVSITPKAGLLTMTAAFIARVPVRIHAFTGQVWATQKGVARGLLRMADTITAWSASDVLADSPSQLAFLRQKRVVGQRRGAVLGNGSIAGVDLAKYCKIPERYEEMRREIGIAQSSTVFMFLGRLGHDKGILDLATAFTQLATKRPNVYLLVVGPDEEGLSSSINDICVDCLDRVKLVGLVSSSSLWLSAADVLCLPSYREGFGSVIIEAAAMGLPAIASRIYGITDAVVDGVTGILHTAGDVNKLREAMMYLTDRPEIRAAMGDAAQTRARTDFASAYVLGEWVKYLQDRVPTIGRGAY